MRKAHCGHCDRITNTMDDPPPFLNMMDFEIADVWRTSVPRPGPTPLASTRTSAKPGPSRAQLLPLLDPMESGKHVELYCEESPFASPTRLSISDPYTCQSPMNGLAVVRLPAALCAFEYCSSLVPAARICAPSRIGCLWRNAVQYLLASETNMSSTLFCCRRSIHLPVSGARQIIRQSFEPSRASAGSRL